VAYKTIYKEVTKTNLAVITPKVLNVSGELPTEERKRGIYKTMVYSAKLSLKGSFELPAEETLARLSLGGTLNKVDWAGARVVVGLSDTKAVRSVGELVLGQNRFDFEPGNDRATALPHGFSAPFSLVGATDELNFAMDLEFGGSGSFKIAPVGRNNEINLSSNWPHPSFIGDGLPVERAINEQGFSAKWKVPDLVHSYAPLVLIEADVKRDKTHDEPTFMNDYLVAIDFFNPTDNYSLIERSTKFGCMFILLTFMILVVSDLLSTGKNGKWPESRQLHPLQYGIVGLALCLFYLTLLSISEHLGFDLAYLAASIITVAMIGGYALAATGNSFRGLPIIGLTTLLYGVLYLILRQEDYALVSGTALLVAVLIVLMALTRKVNQEEDFEPKGPIEDPGVEPPQPPADQGMIAAP
jgi:inner membrane protein